MCTTAAGTCLQGVGWMKEPIDKVMKDPVFALRRSVSRTTKWFYDTTRTTKDFAMSGVLYDLKKRSNRAENGD